MMLKTKSRMLGMEKLMINKKFVAVVLSTVMVAGSSFTTLAAGPGGPGGQGGPGGPGGQMNMEQSMDNGPQEEVPSAPPQEMNNDSSGEQQGQPPQAPDQNMNNDSSGEQQGQPPQAPDQNMNNEGPGEQQGQHSQTPDQNADNGEAPELPANFEEGERPELPEDFEEGEMPELPEDFEEGEMPELPEDFEEGEMPELPEDFEEGEMPELPEDFEEGEMPELPEGFEEGEMPELPEDFEEGEMPELPEDFEEGEMPELPENMNDESGEGRGPSNFFERVGGAIKDGVGKIGNWFKDFLGFGDETEDGEMPEDFEEGEMPEDSEDNMPGGRPGNFGENATDGMPGGMTDSDAPDSYDAAYEATEDIIGDGTETYSSENDDENAILVSEGSLAISDITITKTGDSDGESADFYGTNAGVLANNGSDLTLTNVTVSTDGTHANGVFSYGEGTSLSISDSTITTTGNNSGGLMTTGNASLTADNVVISTSGDSSAAIRTDRGGGTVTATNTSGTTSGVGSPTIYSTADITVADSTLSASNSEAVVIEGGNSVTITDSDVTGNNAILNGQSTTATNVLIYQSMSGDASEGESEFNMTGGSLTSLTGSMFHVTNVTTTINLTGVELNYSDDSDVLIDLSADSWGTEGSNGGNATVNLVGQSASGNIVVDDVSSIVLNITNNSDYTGSINSSNSSGYACVSVDSGSTWTLSGDTYIDSFEGDLSSVDLNGYTLYINGVAYTA